MSDDGLRTGWGGDSIRGRIGTEAKATELVRAWWDALGSSGPARAQALLALNEYLGVGWHIGRMTDTELELDMSRATLDALEAREFRRPGRPHASERTVYLGDGRKVTFRARREELSAGAPTRDTLAAAGKEYVAWVAASWGPDGFERRRSMADASIPGDYGRPVTIKVGE